MSNNLTIEELTKEELNKKILLAYIENELSNIKMQGHDVSTYSTQTEMEDGKHRYEIVIQIEPSTGRWQENLKRMGLGEESMEDPEPEEREISFLDMLNQA